MNTGLEDKVLRMVVEIIEQLDFLNLEAKQEIINQVNFGWQGLELRNFLEKYAATQRQEYYATRWRKEEQQKKMIKRIMVDLQDLLNSIDERKVKEKGGERDG